jgi:hypothetical protein
MTDLSIPALLVFHFQLTNYPAPLLLEFEPTISLAEFILQSTNRIRCIHRLWRMDIELVEGHHAGITTNLAALAAPTFCNINEPPCTLIEKYKDNYTQVSFFVRPVASSSISESEAPIHLCSIQ